MDRYRTIWRRVGAYLIDLAVSFPAVVIGSKFYRYAHGTNVGIFWSALMLVFGLAYSIYFHGRYGATPGKSLMRCRVVAASGEGKISYGTAARREVPTFVLAVMRGVGDHWASFAVPPLAAVLTGAAMCWTFADLFACVATKKRRALHDFIAGTVVVKEEPNQTLDPTRVLVTGRADARSAPSTRVAVMRTL